MRTAILGLAAAGLIAAPASAAEYTVTELKPLAGYVRSVLGDSHGINASGHSVGRSVGGPSGDRAVVWNRHGTPTELATPAGTWKSQATGINGAGVAAGNLAIGAAGDIDTFRAVRWTSPGAYDHFLPDNGFASFAHAISDDGWIGGIRFTQAWDDKTYETYAWSPDGTTHWVTPTVAGARVEFYAANASNVFSGFQFNPDDGEHATAVLWSASSGLVELAGAGGPYTAAQGINDAGIVVGSEWDGDATDTPLWWDAAHDVHLLPNLAGYASGITTEVNNAGQIVGYSSHAGCDFVAVLACRRATLWNVDGTVTDLNDLIDPALGVTLLFASAINERGEIQGQAFNADRRLVAFTLRPAGIPEPSTWTMLIAGFGAMGAMLRRRRTAVRFA